MKNRSLLIMLFILCSALKVTYAEAGPAKSGSLDKCLNNSSIEVKTCLQTQIPKITIGSCYDAAKKVYSNTAKERLKEYCFFNVSEFSNLKSCIAAAGQFYSAESHDEGLFQCYIQFADKIDNRTCFELSKKMIFRNKKIYLANQCENR